MTATSVYLALALGTLAVCTSQAADRSRPLRAEFIRGNPCPATGETRGACPGWEVDHRVSLCSGGPDALHNLEWITVARHREKTKRDVVICRTARVWP